jgi:hypothetical protein
VGNRGEEQKGRYQERQRERDTVRQKGEESEREI